MRDPNAAGLPVPATRSCNIAVDVPLLMVSGTAHLTVPYVGGEMSLFVCRDHGRSALNPP
ncbi:hypothetical protein [Trinickia diaoshuihuensis]|uniref:hypothetical protein n=1 Tax=Trinickia diaoshuihuensis TaxID=2292265 RepID=UPI000E24760A|nr:hypothetical protein [Trinickia diaoshuihuensis]